MLQLFHLRLSAACEREQGRMCLPVLSVFPLSQMSDTRACCLAVDADAAIDSLLTAAS